MTIQIFMDVAAENVHPLYDIAPRAPLDKTVNPRISSRIFTNFCMWAYSKWAY